jgi:hypothetical protein
VPKTLAGFLGLAVQFRQRLPLHLQLHLRVLLGDLRIALLEQLCDPRLMLMRCDGFQQIGVIQATF